MRIKQFCITVVLVSLLALNLRAESSESSESLISDDSSTTAGVTESNKNDTVKEVGDLKSPPKDSEGEKKLWKSKRKDGNFKQKGKEESWRAKSGRDDERRRRYRDDRNYDSDFRDDDRDWRYERPCRMKAIMTHAGGTDINEVDMKDEDGDSMITLTTKMMKIMTFGEEGEAAEEGRLLLHHHLHHREDEGTEGENGDWS
ncbi:hypothetical protein Aperf_G00000005136 [Anoplocephala perfoliata]